MIRYALSCEAGHGFESWFYDSDAFDAQAMRGLVTCPICDSSRVTKAIMAPAVVAGRGEARDPSPETGPVRAPVGPAREPAGESLLIEPERLAASRALRDKVLAETRDVGRRFAAEARRIHEAETPDDRIRGQATLAEARDLLEDGILVLPIPACPDDLN